MNCRTDHFELPQVEFTAGSTEEFAYTGYFHIGHKPFDFSKCKAKFSIINYVNRNGDPLVRKDMTVEKGDDEYDGEVVPNILRVQLDPEDTVDLAGQFIYQVTIKDGGGWAEPKQGIMKIYTNIEKEYTQKSITQW